MDKRNNSVDKQMHFSILTVNTLLGKELLSQIENKFTLFKLDDKDVLEYYLPHNRVGAWGYNSDNQDTFIKEYIKNGFVTALHKTIDWKELETLRSIFRDESNKTVWIYGAGKCGKIVYKIIKEMYRDVVFKGFLVSEEASEGKLYGYDVCAYSRVNKSNIKACAVIVAIKDGKTQKEIRDNLVNSNICKVYLI